MGISRKAQDEYAIMSNTRAGKAHERGWYKNEIQTLSSVDRKSNETTFSEVEECENFFPVQFQGLKPASTKTGTITAANARIAMMRQLHLF